jgi:exonuclease I
VPLKVQGNSLRFDDRVSRHRLRRRLVWSCYRSWAWLGRVAAESEFYKRL